MDMNGLSILFSYKKKHYTAIKLNMFNAVLSTVYILIFLNTLATENVKRYYALHFLMLSLCNASRHDTSSSHSGNEDPNNAPNIPHTHVVPYMINGRQIGCVHNERCPFTPKCFHHRNDQLPVHSCMQNVHYICNTHVILHPLF